MSDPVSKTDHTRDAVVILRDPASIRERAHRLLDIGIAGDLDHFAVHMDKFPKLVDFVASVIRDNYPTLAIPYHSRWRHFSAGGLDRWKVMQDGLLGDVAEQARIAIDLCVVSVLLDAGAGAQWQYHEAETDISMGRSEGLAIASFHMFCNGLFSSDPNNPYCVDAKALKNLDTDALAAGFQISGDNPMTGLEGRIELLRSLSKALQSHSDLFGDNPSRPGHLFDALADGGGKRVAAADILAALLRGFSSIWPGRVTLNDENMGDVWQHAKLRYDDDTDQLMPFHKLSQWLTYSLLEPFEWAGIQVADLDDLTGLAEYRNGGLLLDSGVISLKNSEDANRAHAPSSELIVEWRALTVAFLDNLREPVATALGVDPKDFPLAKLLEGGSWAAGRRLAFERDPSGDPPLNIQSDGTVF